MSKVDKKQSGKESSSEELSSKDKRLLLAEKRKQDKGSLVSEDNSSDVFKEFKSFFSKIRNKYKIPMEQESIIWAHLKAAGFDSSDKFSEGVKHYGIKL